MVLLTMKQILLFLVISNLLCISETSDRITACGNRPLYGEFQLGSRIVGGEDSLPGKWPWMLSIQQRKKSSYDYICGGSIVGRQWVLTAAHCFKHIDREKLTSSLRLVFGAFNLNDTSEVQYRSARKIIQHENYDPIVERNDIALIQLDKPIEFTELVQPACIPTANAKHKRMTECYIAGWGVKKEDDLDPAHILQEAKVKRIPIKRCNSTDWYNGAVKEYNLCAGHEEGRIDTCQGDSGGPLMCKRKNGKIFTVIGITSWGSGCGRMRSPGVYTSTKFFFKWIISTIFNEERKDETEETSADQISTAGKGGDSDSPSAMTGENRITEISLTPLTTVNSEPTQNPTLLKEAKRPKVKRKHKSPHQSQETHSSHRRKSQKKVMAHALGMGDTLVNPPIIEHRPTAGPPVVHSWKGSQTLKRRIKRFIHQDQQQIQSVPPEHIGPDGISGSFDPPKNVASRRTESPLKQLMTYTFKLLVWTRDAIHSKAIQT